MTELRDGLQLQRQQLEPSSAGSAPANGAIGGARNRTMTMPGGMAGGRWVWVGAGTLLIWRVALAVPGNQTCCKKGCHDAVDCSRVPMFPTV